MFAGGSSMGGSRLYYRRWGGLVRLLGSGDAVEVSPGNDLALQASPALDLSDEPRGTQDGSRQVWNDLGRLVTSGSLGAQSLEAVVRMDVHGEGLIFWDDFESGDTLEWTATTP